MGIEVTIQELKSGKKKALIAPSVISADFARLKDELQAIEAAGADWLHCDVMDGQFVPNMTFGPFVVEALKKMTKLPLDCHLMIEDADRFIADFAEAGADMIGVQVEACRHLNRTLQLIADHGMLAGVVLNPATPVEMVFEVLPMVHHVLVMSVNPGFGGQKFLPRSVDRIAHLRRVREEMGLNFRIEVDGGIAHDTVTSVVAAGADMLVAGSAIFQPGKTVSNAEDFLRVARAAAEQRA